MHRTHFLRWLGLAVALLGFQCLPSLSDDCRKTLTCPDDLPILGPDCSWYYSDGTRWEGGPHQTGTGRWLWPNGTETDTQTFVCPLRDAGIPDAAIEGGNCPEVACDGNLLCDEPTGRCVQCKDDSACANVSDAVRGKLAKCDPRRLECVACVRDSDCGAEENCKVDPVNPANNRCVDCLNQTPGQCDGDEVCDIGSNECTFRCTDLGQCRPPKPICSNVAEAASSGVCVECTDSSHCGGTTRQCNTARKECVECVDDSGCTGGLVCNSANRCVQCVDDSRCNGGRCDLATNQCVECLTDAQCTSPDRSHCNAVTHLCEACSADVQCESDAPVCNEGRCVVCKDDSRCTTEGARRCDVPSGTCVACLNSADCTSDPTLARCETMNHACAFCTSSTQCAGKFGVRELCRMNNGECVQCLNNGNCASDPNNARCDQDLGLCRSCTGDADCSSITGRRACTGGNSGRCVECVNNTHCANNPNGSACNPATNTCVQCVADTDCRTAGASRCVQNRCQPCVNDAGGTHCGHIVNGATTLGVCDTSAGANAGVCVQCTGAQRAACNGNVCNSLTKTCSPFGPGTAGLCQDCVSDAHCGANLRCVQERFNDAVIAGAFSCFPVAQAGDCSQTPFVGLATLNTVDGVSSQVCNFRRTTCAGFLQSGRQPCTVNADCGEASLDDGRCDATLDLCSVPCTSVIDCPDVEQGTCSGGACSL